MKFFFFASNYCKAVQQHFFENENSTNSVRHLECNLWNKSAFAIIVVLLSAWANASVSPGTGHRWQSSTGVGVVSLLHNFFCVFFGNMQVRTNQLDHNITPSSNRNMKLIRCNSTTFNRLQNLNAYEVVFRFQLFFCLVVCILASFFCFFFYFSLLHTEVINTQKRLFFFLN